MFPIHRDNLAVLTENRAQEKCTGWEFDLRENGFAVVKNAIPRDRATQYQTKAYDWLKSFSTELDFNRPETWIKENLPVQSKINTFNGYAVVHEKFMWDARMEPGVLDAFANIWGTDELLSSFDSLNITFPNRKDVTQLGAWAPYVHSQFSCPLNKSLTALAFSKLSPLQISQDLWSVYILLPNCD